MMSYKKLFIFLVVSLMVCVVFIFSMHDNLKNKAIEELNNRQTVYARLAAKGLETAFEHHLNTLRYLSQNEHIIRMDPRGKDLLRSIQEMPNNDIKGFSRLNAQGRIIFTWPHNPETLGRDISDQAHVRKILQNRRPSISDIFTTVQGFEAIAIHMPVYRGKTFDGTIALLLSFEDLAKEYLDHIHRDTYRQVWLISAQGTIIYCPFNVHQGQAALDILPDSPAYAAMIREMMQGKEGVTAYRDASHTGGTQPQKRHAVYLPVQVGDTHWSIVVSTSEDSLLALLKDFRKQGIALGLILLFVFVAMAYVAARLRGENLAAQKRRQIEADLVASAREIHDLYHNAPCGYHSLDEEGKIVRINETELAWLGYTREELIGRPYTQILSDASRAGFQSAFARLKQQGNISDVEYDMLRKDGSRLPVLVTASAVTDEQGRFVMSRSMVMDISSRCEVEERLRESEELYRTALETTSDGISIVQKRKYVYVNKKLMETIGRPDESLIGKTAGVHIHPDDRKLLAENYEATVKDMPVPHSTYDLRIVKPDGSVAIVSVINVTITYRGEPATLAFITDITQKRQYEAALRESEELYRTALESTSDGVTIVQKGKYVYVNRRMLDTIGRPDLNLIGAVQGAYIHPDDWSGITEAFDHRQKGDPIPTDYELRVAKPDGSEVHLHINTVIVKYQGAPAMLSFVRDITKQKETENALRESEALYRTAMESTSDGITIADIEEGKYLYVNQKLMETLGRPGENIVGGPVDLYVHPEDIGLGKKYLLERKKEHQSVS
ncbi:MAG: PAS domain S-box protein, partial [Smithellaceae bacterium]